MSEADEAWLSSVDQVGGWKSYRVVPDSQRRGRQTITAQQPPLIFGFESEGCRRREQRGAVVTPLASSAKQEEPLLASQRRGTAAEVELVHSPLPGTLRPSSRRGEPDRGRAWRPASSQSGWQSVSLMPSARTTSPPPPTVPDAEAALARAEARGQRAASQAQSPRMGPLQRSAKDHTSRVMNARAAGRLAEARPLSAAQLRDMQPVFCRFGRPDALWPAALWRNDAGRPSSCIRHAVEPGLDDRGETFHRVRLRDFDEDGGLTCSERRASRAIISTRLSSARRGAKRFL